MKPAQWEERVELELKELWDRLERLDQFLLSEPFNALELEDRQLLVSQRTHMDDYRAILTKRLGRAVAKRLKQAAEG